MFVTKERDLFPDPRPWDSRSAILVFDLVESLKGSERRYQTHRLLRPGTAGPPSGHLDPQMQWTRKSALASHACTALLPGPLFAVAL